MSDTKSYFDDVVEKHFGRLDKPKDWAETIARETVAVSLDNANFLAGTSWSKEEQLCFILATQLAIELRGLRRQAQDAKTIHVDGQVASARKKLRERFESPSFMAEYIRDAAGILDNRGMAHEANVMRDAASILDTEF